MIPVLFKKNEQQFRTYGLGEITDIINPKVTRERNGQYLLYFQYPQNAELSDVFEEDMRIKSDAGVRTKWQTFEISRVIRKEGQLIEVFAKHISQSLLKDALNPSVIVRTSTAQQALNIWNNNRIGDENFDVWSDISTISSTSWNIRDVSNAFEALAGVQGSILDVWGGEYEFDNKMIRLHKEMGRKSPVPLEYGRNITGLEQDQQDDNVYTSVYPFATYIPESGSEPETVTLPERYVDGKYLEMHNKRKIQVVDFSGEYDIDNPPTVSSLRTIANHYLEANEVGLPHENLKVEYVDLSKTLDYQEFQTMEEVELNDKLPIFYPKFGITNENAKVVVINYDPVKEENISIELGVIGQSFRTVTTGGIGSRLDRIEQQQNETASYIVNAQGNRIWYTTPDENMEHKIGDTWFEENGQYTRIRVWNGSQWIIEIDTEDIDKNAKAIAEQQEDIEQAQATADEAVNRINGEIAGKFTSIETEISQVHNDAQNALNQAGEAVSQVAYFGETLDGFTQTVANIDGRVTNIRQDVDGITQTVTDQTGKIATVEQNVNGIQETVSDPVNGLVTQVSTLASGFNVLATDFENMEIGGRNLLRNSGNFTDASGWSGGTVVEKDGYKVIERNGGMLKAEGIGLNIEPNSEYMYSGWFMSSEDYDSNNINSGQPLHSQIRYGGSNSGGSLGNRIISKPNGIIPANTWFRIVVLVRTIKEAPNGNIRFAPYVYGGSFTDSKYWVRDFKLEKGTKATDWTPAIEDMASQAQLSVLNDNINMRVSKGELMSQINIEAGRTLIQSNKLYLDAQSVVFSGQAFIPGANIQSLSADKINAGTLNAANVRVINLDFDTAVGNRTNFIRSAWETAAGGSVTIRGSGILSTAGDGSQVYIQNGIVGARTPAGHSSGHIGVAPLGFSPNDYSIQTSWGSKFQIYQVSGRNPTTYQNTLTIAPNSENDPGGAMSINVSNIYAYSNLKVGNILTVDSDITATRSHMSIQQVNWRYGSWIYDSSSNSDFMIVGGGRLRFYTRGASSAGSLEAFRADNTHTYMYRTLSMEGHNITNQSDERLKFNIEETNVNSLEEIKSMHFVEFDRTNGNHDEIGVIAQDTPSLALYDSERDMWSINSSKQIMMNSHAIQQLALREQNTNLVASQALINSETNAEKIKQLEKRIEELESAA